MRARTSLTLALVTGSMAVLLVGVDIAWTLESSLEGRYEDEGWVTLARAPYDGQFERFYRYGHSCPLLEARLVLDNDAPFAVKRHVEVWYHGQTSDPTLYRGTVRIPAGKEITIALEVPQMSTENETRWHGDLNARVGDDWLYASACAPSPVRHETPPSPPPAEGNETSFTEVQA